MAVTTDPLGNVYLAGRTEGPLGGTNQGSYDGWIKKYSADGVLLWRRQPGTSGVEEIGSVATDKLGNVYLAGSTTGSLAGTNRGGYDAWIAKYSSTGALVWKRQLGTADDDFAHRVATDQQGSIYVAGLTFGSLAANNHGEGDAWIAKYSAAAPSSGNGNLERRKTKPRPASRPTK